MCGFWGNVWRRGRGLRWEREVPLGEKVSENAAPARPMCARTILVSALLDAGACRDFLREESSNYLGEEWSDEDGEAGKGGEANGLLGCRSHGVAANALVGLTCAWGDGYRIRGRAGGKATGTLAMTSRGHT